MELLVYIGIAWLLQKAWDGSGASTGSTSRPARAVRAVAARVGSGGRGTDPARGGPGRASVTAAGAGWVRERLPAFARRWAGRRADTWRRGWQEGRDLARGRLPGDPPLTAAGGDGSAVGTDPTNPSTSTPGLTGTGPASPEGDTMSAPAPSVPAPATPTGPSGGQATGTPGRGRGGGVAAAEFTIGDLIALAERWRKEADYAASQMEAGKMGTDTVNGLRGFQEAAAGFLSLMHRLHGGVRQAINDAPVVGESSRYVDR